MKKVEMTIDGEIFYVETGEFFIGSDPMKNLIHSYRTEWSDNKEFDLGRLAEKIAQKNFGEFSQTIGAYSLHVKWASVIQPRQLMPRD